MKTFLLLFLSASMLILISNCKNAADYPYKDPNLDIEKRVDDLISRMTQEEKIKQLDMYWGKEVANMGHHEAESYNEKKVPSAIDSSGIGSVHDFYPLSSEITNQIQKYAKEKTRLGIPVLFIEEGLHGYEGAGSTTFPVPLALAAAFDTSLVEKIGRVIGTETRAHGVNMILGPVLCLPRDPRWGRVEETYGEDPCLAALNGVAMVKGMQGSSLKNSDAVISEPKHFAMHGIPEAGSNTSPVSIGEREARSSFLYVFEKAVREGGAMGIMAAYHDFDGIPCVDNKWLLTDILRKEWGFKGFVLSDLGAIKMSVNDHKVATNIPDGLAQTFTAGMNMQFYDYGHLEFMNGMKEALKNKLLSENDLNRAVKDVLRVKFMLGLFENPYIDPKLVSNVYHNEEHKALALEAAQKAICLLKNEKNILPLKKQQSVLVVGALAQSQYLGGYSNRDGKAISILDGIKERANGDIKISYEKGYASDTTPAYNKILVQQSIAALTKSDVAVVVLGEDLKVVGEGKDRAHIDLDENQMTLVKALKETGKPIIVVLFNGRPLAINWIAQNVPAIVESWFCGEMTGLAVADVLLGNVNPSGKLPMTFPRSIGQVPFYYNHKPTSHHNYVDEANTPLFCFGYGLSYTTFEYSDLQISPEKIEKDGAASVKVKIKNTGNYDGAEVVQLYVRDEVSSVTTPLKSLKAFQRIHLKKGDSAVVTFAISKEQLALWNREMKYVVEPGDFNIMIGSSSDDIRLERKLTVN